MAEYPFVPQSTPPSSRRRSMGGRSGTMLLILLLLAALGAFGWSYYKYHQTQRQLTALTDPNVKTELDKQQTKALLAKVGKLIVIPSNEDPVVAIISDVETLANDQNFYKDAKNGDKLIIFYGAQKAIIYDEQANVLVNVGPVFIKDQNGNDQPIAKVDGKLNLEIRNGSSTSGKAVTLRDKLKADTAFVLVRLSKAANANYSDTVIVDQTGGKKPDLIKKLQDQVGVTATTNMPVGEAASDAEAVIIVGNK